MMTLEKPYIIGETAFHHQGDLAYLKNLIFAASDLQLDAIKFHLLFDPGDYFVEKHPAFETIQSWIFSPEEWQEVFDLADEHNLDIIALCNDIESLRWVKTECLTSIKAIEIHATGINDVFLLQEASEFNSTVILGIGGSSMDQLNFAVDFLQKRDKNDIFLMYGFQNYPTDYSDINFSKMDLIKEIFSLPIGYADHTDPLDENNAIISASAILKGAYALEKHFTLDISEKRIDSQAAVSLERMREIMNLSKVLFLTAGEGGLNLSAAEKKYGDVGPMKKAIVAKKSIPLGKVITPEDLAYKRTPESSYLDQSDIQLIIGSKSITPIEKDEVINYSNVQFRFNVGDIAQFNNTTK